jgi:hypothetical protein
MSPVPFFFARAPKSWSHISFCSLPKFRFALALVHRVSSSSSSGAILSSLPLCLCSPSVQRNACKVEAGIVLPFEGEFLRVEVGIVLDLSDQKT